MLRVRLRGGLLLKAAAIVGAVTASAHGANGFRVTLPAARTQPAYSAATGLSMTVDSRWPGAAPYRPIRVEIGAAASVQRDREIAIALHFMSRRRREPFATVRQKFSLRAGETRVEGVVSVPIAGGDHRQPWERLYWETEVDGQPEPALSIHPVQARAAGNNGQAGDLTVFRPKLDADGILADGRLNQYTTLDGFIADEKAGRPSDRWIHYASLDVVLLDPAVLEQIISADAAGLEVLLRWVAAGGSLWVERVAEIDGLNRLTEKLGGDGMRFGAVSALGDRPVEGAAGWWHESLAPRAERAEAADSLDLQSRLGELTSAIIGRDSRGWYAVREYGFGQVRAFQGDAFVPPKNLGQKERQQAVARWRDRGWAYRHGMSAAKPSRQFGNLLIPGIGTAPVGEFQVLITLFVLGIGPLNYWLLWRAQRLHLLVLTTPLAAAAATLGLIGYALVSDGFGVKARVRSLTLLNQQADGANLAASWSRVSQYAASAPTESFAFDKETVVYPIQPAWESAVARRDAAPRVVEWDDRRQLLSRGWLPTRTATQHLVVRCGETDRGVRFSPADAPSECRNELGAKIELLLVHPRQGEWFLANDIAEGVTASLAPIDRLDALSELRTRTIDNKPEFPIGADEAATETINRLQFSPRRRRSSDLSALSLNDNLMNKSLERLVGLEGGGALPLAPRSYIAVTHAAVDSPLGFEPSAIREIGSFHVVVGKW